MDKNCKQKSQQKSNQNNKQNSRHDRKIVISTMINTVANKMALSNLYFKVDYVGAIPLRILCLQTPNVLCYLDQSLGY